MPPLLGRSRRVQPVLEQPPLQLPAPRLQLLLQVSVLQPGRLLRRRPLLKLTEALPRLRERLVLGRHVPLHRAPSFAIRSSDNRDRNEKEPSTHTPTRQNRTQDHQAHQNASQYITSE